MNQTAHITAYRSERNSLTAFALAMAVICIPVKQMVKVWIEPRQEHVET